MDGNEAMVVVNKQAQSMTSDHHVLDIASLDEAMNTPLPRLPPRARLPPAFRPSQLVIHPPPFFDNLARATLPTASISQPPAAAHHHDTLSTPLVRSNPVPTVVTAPLTRSSLDTLRSVHSRTFSTSAPVPQPKPWWSFATDATPTAGPEKKSYLAPRHPIVFCHGLLGFDSVVIGPAIAPLEVTHWRGIKEVLEENGAQVLITRVPATSSPADRAKVLAEKIAAVYPGQSVHLIGHSMGGLDCRYLATHIKDRPFKVLSITTIATPHRGSSFADHFLSTVGLHRMPSVLSLLDMLPNGGGDGQAFNCLTLESMRKFNEETPDVPGIKYFSWGAVYEPGLIDTWKWPHSGILEKEGPNDGLVSIESSKWGTYLGTLSEVNHLDLVGWINTARYKWAEIMGKEIKFRPATFYLGIADMLAREVEGLIEPPQMSSADETHTAPASAATAHPSTLDPAAQALDSLSNAGAIIEPLPLAVPAILPAPAPISRSDPQPTPAETKPSKTKSS